MISVDVDSLDTETLKSLVDSHENLLFSKKTETDFLALGFPSLEEKGPRREVEVVPREALQELAKTHLKAVVFSLLREKPMCGYHLIKSIHRRYHVLISQGTVYPLLYNLTEQGILEVKTQNRFKIYSLTEKGKAFAEDKIRTLLQVHRYAAEVLKTN
jgi:DNA-binding PadR family transcriptional regulator